MDREGVMPEVEYVIRSLAGRRVAGRSVTIRQGRSIGEVVGPLFGTVAEQLSRIGACPETGVAVYEPGERGMSALICYDYAGEDADGLDVIDLPPVDQAVCTVHRGSTDGIGEAWMSLHSWLLGHGYRPSAPGREVYLQAAGEDQSTWVTELQQPVQPTT
jgi:effector-binding domain-containing protein